MIDDKAAKRNADYKNRQEHLDDGPIWFYEREKLEKILNDKEAAPPDQWNGRKGLWPDRE